MISINTVFDTAILISESKKKNFLFIKKKTNKNKTFLLSDDYTLHLFLFNYIEC